MNMLFKILKQAYNYFYPPRKAIPKRIKDAAWIKYNGNRFNGRCYCCGCLIDKKNYHNSHVIPHVLVVI